VFKKILIANRGEIACRVIKTARRMGIKTVAVYSDADSNALHVEMADEAVNIGPAPSAQSYLVIDRIVQACRDTGAEAVHPGYGFLSEREAFAEALAKVGVTFIGPNVKAIAAMGDKIESKKLALAAKVNTGPGFIGEIKDDSHARKIANEIGYPVMVKASAGGGGKGLRIVHKEDDLVQAIKSSQHEAKASFGDDRLFIEKFVTEPRHIEIQLIGDKHGNVLYLNERECSIQRRHQKVIEEAPSPFLDAATRKAMGEQAVALAKAVGYDSAGTVEFIVDKDRKFYFLEMNTRLQVEHPVTELITSVDLVELMIRSAAGEKLALKQSDVGINGWAVETRIYAEDPYRGFLPSIGRLVRYRPPAEGSRGDITIRNDTGVYEGGEISMFYDPMIAKLCTHAPTRLAAIDAMAVALDRFRIEGIHHNIAFLTAIMHNKRFREGRLTTAFIAEEFPDGFHGQPLDNESRRSFVAAAVAARLVRALRASGISGTMNGAHRVASELVVSLDGKDFAVAGANLAAGNLHLLINGKPFRAITEWQPGQPIMVLSTTSGDYTIQLTRVQGGYKLGQGGRTVTAVVRSPEAAALAALMPKKIAADTSKMLICPMPGLIVSVIVAERDGTIKKINAAKGDSLALDDVILEFA
jgi:propionyl-CoA carboxylase alpha chain